MRWMAYAVAGWFWGTAALAVSAESEQPWPELTGLVEHPVAGMSAGNLSGLARCQGQLWAISDREDRHLHRLNTQNALWQATAEPFAVPDLPASLPWTVRTQAALSAWVRGGAMDFEGISCDGAGQRYLVSEAYASVLRLGPEGTSEWLALPELLWTQAQAQGLLRQQNAFYEGLAVDASATHLWLAAERTRRGLLQLEFVDGHWLCPKQQCILFLDAPADASSAAPAETAPSLDFSDLVWFRGKLFTLERQARWVCRRDSASGAVERCWSFAVTAQQPNGRYPTPYGVAEALWLEDDRILIGLDNNDLARADGETRPIVWQFSAPEGGWLAP